MLCCTTEMFGKLGLRITDDIIHQKTGMLVKKITTQAYSVGKLQELGVLLQRSRQSINHNKLCGMNTSTTMID